MRIFPLLPVDLHKNDKKAAVFQEEDHIGTRYSIEME
jgi:hypothetical protein